MLQRYLSRPFSLVNVVLFLSCSSQTEVVLHMPEISKDLPTSAAPLELEAAPATSAVRIPEIDRAVPAKFETATFALG